MIEPGYILLYHGVTDSEPMGIENFSGKHVSKLDFENQMKFLSENCKVVSLREMSRSLESELECPKNYVSVTFDDTFRNIYDVAFPILKKYNIPATFFITTGMIDSDKLFWVDQLERMINFSKKDILSVQIPRSERLPVKTRSEKIYAIRAIKSFLKLAHPDIRDRTLEKIHQQIGEIDPPERRNYQNLTSSQIKEIASTPGYEIGGHTVSHEILSYLGENELDYEIDECISALAKITEKTIDLFSYPEGQLNHFNKDVIKKLKASGVVVCPSAVDGVNYPGANPFYLKRIMVGFMEKPFPFKLSK